MGARCVWVWGLLCLMSAMIGCSTTAPKDKDAGRVQEPTAREVRVEGIDGTVFRGELLNGTVTIDSGQGSLTLLTDHIHDIVITQEFDTIRSDAVDVSGSIKESTFLVKSDHGVFTLYKERLRKIEFVASPAPPTPPIATTMPTTTHAQTKPATTTTNARPVTGNGTSTATTRPTK